MHWIMLTDSSYCDGTADYGSAAVYEAWAQKKGIRFETKYKIVPNSFFMCEKTLLSPSRKNASRQCCRGRSSPGPAQRNAARLAARRAAQPAAL